MHPPLHKRVDHTTTSNRGRHLIATQPIPQYTLLFHERPLLLHQSCNNAHHGALVCRTCRCFVGNPQVLLELGCGLIGRAEVFQRHDELQQKNCSDDDEIGGWGLVACRYQCGESFCCTECEEEAWVGHGHGLLCTGRLASPSSALETFHDDNHTNEIVFNNENGDKNDKNENDNYKDDLHPLLQFKMHAVQTNEVLLMVADLIATVLCRRAASLVAAALQSQQDQDNDKDSDKDNASSASVASPTLEKILSPYIDFVREPWWDVACHPLLQAAESHTDQAKILQDSLMELCQNSSSLLQKAMHQVILHWNDTPIPPSSKQSLLFTEAAGTIEKSSSHSYQKALLQAFQEGQAHGLFTKDFFARCMGSFEQNAIGVRARHKLASVVFSSRFRHRKDTHEALVKCLGHVGLLPQEEEVEEEDCEAEEEQEDEGETMQIGTAYDVNKVALLLSQLDLTPVNQLGDTHVEDPHNHHNHVQAQTDSQDEHSHTNDHINTNTNTQEEEEVDDEEDEKSFDGDDLDLLFSPLDGTAMFSTACMMNHSCEPNVMVRYSTGGDLSHDADDAALYDNDDQNIGSGSGNGNARNHASSSPWQTKRRRHPLVLQCVALRDISQGEELCISYIDGQASLEERRKQLLNYGFECHCTKCCREANEEEESKEEEKGVGVEQVPMQERGVVNVMEDVFGSDSDSDCDCDCENHVKQKNGEIMQTTTIHGFAAGTTSTQKDKTTFKSTEINDDYNNDSATSSIDAEEVLGQTAQHVFASDVHSLGALPKHIYGPAASYVIGLATTVLKVSSNDSNQDNAEEEKMFLKMRKHVEECLQAMQQGNLYQAQHAGAAGEALALGYLFQHGGFPPLLPWFREAYMCCMLAMVMSLANGVGTMNLLEALQALDRAMVLGLKRGERGVGGLCEYVEFFASQTLAIPGIDGVGGLAGWPTVQIADYRLTKYKEELELVGLEQPIRFSVEEVSVEDDGWGGFRADFLEKYVSNERPVVMRRYAQKWPAVQTWRNLSRFIQLHGHRVVPIEVGGMGRYASKNSKGLKERFMTLQGFMEDYMTTGSFKEGHQNCWSLADAVAAAEHNIEQVERYDKDSERKDSPRVAYLAQHELFEQIPSLLLDVVETPDVLLPDGSIDSSSSTRHVLRRNVWIGTGGTRTPLHYDSLDNIFVQVVGAKYVRLYDSSQTANLYVIRKGSEENGGGYAAQGNMSAINCEMEDRDLHPLAAAAKCTEVLLLPGDALFIPAGMWHYVRSLSSSFSVNYWF